MTLDPLDLSELDAWQPNPGAQAAFAYDDDSDVKILTSGNRGGKSHIAARCHVRLRIINQLPGLCVADSYAQMTTTMVPELLRAAREADLEPEWRVTDRVVLYWGLPSDCTEWGCVATYMRSALHGKSISNFAVSDFWGDEWALWPIDEDNPENDATVQVFTRWSLEAPIMQGFFTGTHQGFGTPLYKHTHELELPEGWNCYQGTTYDNTDNLAPGFATRIKAAIPRHLIPQILEGRPVQPGAGLAYPEFTKAMHVDPALVYNPALPLVLCVDFNVSPLVWIVGQFTGRGLALEAFIIDELSVKDGGLTKTLLREFCNRYGPNGHGHLGDVYLYGDASGKNRSTLSRETNYSQITGGLKVAFGRENVKKRVPRGNPSEADRVAKFNRMLLDGLDVAHLTVYPGARYLIRDCEQVKTLADGSLEKKTSGEKSKLTHASDALGYWFAKEIPDSALGDLPESRHTMKHQPRRRSRAKLKSAFSAL